MTISLSIHPQAGWKPGDLMFRTIRPHQADNANAVLLRFLSKERHAKYDFNTVDTEVTLFHLNDTDAEILSTLGLLDAEHRAALLPTLRHLMDDQTAEAEIALEEASEAAG